MDPGIIPAYAGSTFSSMSGAGVFRDHPRIRGEHPPRRFAGRRRRGSSPHTRGARRHRRGLGRGSRIIPAYAGSTALDVQAGIGWRDHPRIRGEHYLLVQPPAGGGGSSPHTRGALDDSDQYVIDGRIIPAYAGSTICIVGLESWRADHPRIRGEHAPRHYRLGALVGSSPHTRGARRRVGAVADPGGIIPAYAGSTPRL